MNLFEFAMKVYSSLCLVFISVFFCSVWRDGTTLLQICLIWQIWVWVLFSCDSHRHYIDIDTTQSILNNPSGPQSNAIKYKLMIWIWSLFCQHMSSHMYVNNCKVAFNFFANKVSLMHGSWQAKNIHWVGIVFGGITPNILNVGK